MLAGCSCPTGFWGGVFAGEVQIHGVVKPRMEEIQSQVVVLEVLREEDMFSRVR